MHAPQGLVCAWIHDREIIPHGKYALVIPDVLLIQKLPPSRIFGVIDDAFAKFVFEAFYLSPVDFDGLSIRTQEALLIFVFTTVLTKVASTFFDTRIHISFKLFSKQRGGEDLTRKTWRRATISPEMPWMPMKASLPNPT